MRTSAGIRQSVIVAASTAAVAAMLAACGEGEASDAASPPGATPASAASVSAAPTESTNTETAKAIPSSIPDEAFLQASDVPGKVKEKPRRLGAGDQDLPLFCDAEYYQGTGVGIRATQSLYFVEADAPAGSTPKAATYEDVLIFKGDGAATFMRDLRAAVQGCASQKDESGVPVRNYLRGEIGAGDESALIERTRPATDDAGEPVGGGALHHLYWTAVRVGDSVAFVSNTGWESVSADRADTVHLGGKAASRLAAWRG